ncbi:hypothetical protein [Isoptericola sp. NPDC056134]|uniref:hypothetical protein n=1 Tax=Isoptericola sp. NPDC056134 TaxID=3345723 RepID=UPI0035E5501A
MTSAQADDETPPPADGSVSFGYFESQNFEDVFEDMRRDNAVDDVAALLTEAAKDPDASGLPGLESLSDMRAQDLLLAAAKAAENRTPIPSSVLTSETARSMPTNGWVSTGPAPLQSLLGPTAPVAGAAANNNKSWVYSDRYVYETCDLGPIGCEIDSTMNFRLTTDPGAEGTRTSVNITRVGTNLNGLDLDSVVYSSGSQIHSSRRIHWNPGTGIHWNSPHLSLTGKRFQAQYTITIVDPAGVAQAMYSTGQTATCGDPNGGGWGCRFP